MRQFIRLLGGLAVLIELRPGARRAEVQWLCAEAWGDGTIEAPGQGWPGEEYAERWADTVADSVRSAAGAGIAGGYTWSSTAMRVDNPTFGETSVAVRVRTAIGPTPRVRRLAPLLDPPPVLARGRGAVPYGALARGLVEGLLPALDEARADLGDEHAHLRRAMEGIYRTASSPTRASLADVTVAAYGRWRRPREMAEAPALWWAAVAQSLVGILMAAYNGVPWAFEAAAPPPPADGRNLASRVQRLACRVTLARARRTEDPEEARAALDADLRAALDAEAVGPGLADFLRGR